MRSRLLLLSCAALCSLGSLGWKAQADTITYTFSGTISGAFVDANSNLTPIANDPFTATLIGDTNGVGSNPIAGLISSSVFANITLVDPTLGTLSGTTANEVSVFTQGFQTVGLVDLGQGVTPATGFVIFAPGLDPAYDLTTSTGPVVGLIFSAGNPLVTSFGAINFVPDGADITFTATVPEPGSVALLAGMGISGAGFLAHRRKQTRKAA